MDISEEGVAKTKNRGFEASIFDFSDKLTFADKTFDVVVSLDVLEHLYNPESLLKEASRVSNRFVIIGVPNFNSLPARIQVFLEQCQRIIGRRRGTYTGLIILH